MFIDRRLLHNFDWVLVGLVVTLALMGILNLYSASHLGGEASSIYVRQATWLAIGLVLMLAAAAVDYHWLETYAHHVYAAALVLLVVVLVAGRTVSGSQRWLTLGPVVVQPSELAKLGLVAALARFFLQGQVGRSYTLRDLLIPLGILGAPFVLIALQPDLGTALLLAAIFFSLVFFVGMRWKSFLIVLVSGLAALPVFWSAMKDYQKSRVLTFFDPQNDPLGAGYHVIQSKIAVGSGQLMGKGFLKGTQSHLYFLPERHTDFIFSVWAEEWGFMGAALAVIIYAMLIVWGLNIARRSKDRFGRLLAYGLTANLFWQGVVNIGMVLGLLPVVGVPLPLFSYGGSSLLTTLVSVGLLLNVSMRRFMFQP